MNPSYTQPALIGGVVMGVLSALPLVSAGNLCCCLWVIIGGAVAAYVLQQNQPTPISPGDGALVGLFAGFVGAVVEFIVSIPMTLLIGPWERALARQVFEMAGDMPPGLRNVMEQAGRADWSIARVIIGRMVVFIFFLFISAVFSTLGGLIGAAIFKKQTPPGTIDVTPTAPAP